LPDFTNVIASVIFYLSFLQHSFFRAANKIVIFEQFFPLILPPVQV